MAEKRKADTLVGGNSLADRLRKRRMAIEDGDEEAAQAAMRGEPTKYDEDNSSTDEDDSTKRKKRNRRGLLRDLEIN